MNGPTSDGFHDQVAGALYVQSALDGARVALGQLNRIRATEEVRSVQQVHVQRMTLDPLPAIEKTPQRGDPIADDDAARVFHRGAGRHLVRDRADAANPRRDGGGLAKPATHEHRLEVAGRFENVERHIGHFFVTHPHAKRAFPLDARDALGADGAHGLRAVGHCSTRALDWPPDRASPTDVTRLASSRKAGAAALKVCRSRTSSSSDVPRLRSLELSDGALPLSLGPKQP